MKVIVFISLILINISSKGEYVSDKKVNFNWFLGPIKYNQNNYREFFEEHFKYTLKTYTEKKKNCALVGSWGLCLDNIASKFKSKERPEYDNIKNFKKGDQCPILTKTTLRLLENDVINLIEKDLKEVVNNSTLMAKKCHTNLANNLKKLNLDKTDKEDFSFTWKKIPKVVRTALIALTINNDIDLRTSAYLSYLKLNVRLFQKFFDCEFIEFGKTIKEMAYYSTNSLFYKNLSDLVLTLDPKCDGIIKLMFIINDNYKNKENLKISLNIIEKTFQHLSNNNLEIGIYSYSDKLYTIFDYKKIQNSKDLNNLKKIIDSHQKDLNLKNKTGKDLSELVNIIKNNNNKSDLIKTGVFIFSNNETINNIGDKKNLKTFDSLKNFQINISAIQVDRDEKRHNFNKFSKYFEKIVNDKSNIIDVKNYKIKKDNKNEVESDYYTSSNDIYALIIRECNPLNYMKQNSRNNYLPIINKVPEVIKISSKLGDKFVIEIDIGKYKEEYPLHNKGKITIMPQIPNPDCYFNIYSEKLENKSYKFLINHEEIINHWKEKSRKLNVNCKTIDIDKVDFYKTIPNVKNDSKFIKLLENYDLFRTYELAEFINYKKYYSLFYAIKKNYISMKRSNKNYINSNEEINKSFNKDNIDIFIKIESEENISSIITVRKCRINECNHNNDLKISRRIGLSKDEKNKNKKPKIKVDYELKTNKLSSKYNFNFNAIDN